MRITGTDARQHSEPRDLLRCTFPRGGGRSLLPAPYAANILEPNNNSYASGAEAVIKFIFSWVMLMPVSVIISGKLLSEVLKLRVRSKQLFGIERRVAGVSFEIQATDNEVILGFTGFIITLMVIAVPLGHRAYDLFREQFGIDPGQFTSLCILSSLSTVIWTFILYVIQTVSGKIGKTTTDPVAAEHKELIGMLSRGETLSEEEKEDDAESAE
jgi:hypothetical protein